jgi:hypothetical protein
MPFDEVMHKFKHGNLHSGSKSGKKVTNKKQAIAVMLSEKKKSKSNPEYKVDISPSDNFKKKHGVK